VDIFKTDPKLKCKSRWCESKSES